MQLSEQLGARRVPRLGTDKRVQEDAYVDRVNAGHSVGELPAHLRQYCAGVRARRPAQAYLLSEGLQTIEDAGRRVAVRRGVDER